MRELRLQRSGPLLRFTRAHFVEQRSWLRAGGLLGRCRNERPTHERRENERDGEQRRRRKQQTPLTLIQRHCAVVIRKHKGRENDPGKARQDCPSGNEQQKA